MFGVEGSGVQSAGANSRMMGSRADGLRRLN